MHVLKGKVTERGPMIEVKVMVTSQRVAALKQAGTETGTRLVCPGA